MYCLYYGGQAFVISNFGKLEAIMILMFRYD